MNIESFFPKDIKTALEKNPPGAWMSAVPDGCIRLNSGYPATGLVPAAEIKSASARLLDEEKDLPLHYLGSPRIDKLKEQIQERLGSRGMHAESDELLITAGACQAIDLIARILLDAQAVVAVEAPTYMEALEVFQNYTSQIISIPIDDKGLETEQLETVLAERKKNGLTLPRLVYTIPNFQNPTGTTMSSDRREHLLALSKTYDFLILEDDAYGELSFGEIPQTLKAMDTDDRVLHVGSLSKVVAPGMRIGWIAGSSQFIPSLAWFKKDLDHPFVQSIMAAYLEQVNLEQRTKQLKDKYSEKCTRLINALEQYLSDQASWYVPEGGYFVWVKIPGVNTTNMLPYALNAGVAYVPGQYFFMNQEEGTEYLRLSFSYADEREIEKGVQILGEVVKETL
ncbi:aminotransferase-like domain-containing protein [Cytobacillus purgationiresistens]|uniref:2-aminoadipate transaminase n=1 Tax=Cytobacillus purgationiresistens TaxID=863449 RepID=A0ABU0ATT4_9BACI|nr:PLP-dependent aminotransferase family protein [Cytobacillus purgationiresistens]MDQ0273440.1 2-aminoadipate transaminase [Cytobacillus purgationiresistens]